MPAETPPTSRRRKAGRGVLGGAVVVALGAGGSAAAASATTSAAPASAPQVVGKAGHRPGDQAETPAFPADLDAGPRATCLPDVTPGWLTRENARRGIAVAVPRPRTPSTLYLDTVSAVCGQVVRASVSAPAGTYRLRAVRVGWYGGRGGRVVSKSAPFVATRQKDAKGTANALSPGWRPNGALTVGADWAPGMYVVQLLAGSRLVQSAPLVVLAPRTARRAPVLFVVPAMTWTAYSSFGGRSLYRNWNLHGAAARQDRARRADLARPLAGPGVSSVHRYTTPLIRQVERAGVDVDYAADLDLDRTPSLAVARRGIVTGSHTEYVTRRIYDTFDTARDMGTNLAFLGGNGFYWQARVTRDASRRPVSVLVYRKAGEDPSRRSARHLTTVKWRQFPLKRPEAGLMGGQFSGLGVVMPLAVLQAPAWLGWKKDQVLPLAAGGEVDAAVPGGSPAGVSVLAAGGVHTGRRTVQAMVTYYVAPSGAAVFSAGSIFAGCSADDSCEVVDVPAVTSTFWSTTIRRVVTAFATPRFGAANPAPAPGVVPAYSQLLARFGPTMKGSTMGDDD